MSSPTLVPLNPRRRILRLPYGLVLSIMLGFVATSSCLSESPAEELLPHVVRGEEELAAARSTTTSRTSRDPGQALLHRKPCRRGGRSVSPYVHRGCSMGPTSRFQPGSSAHIGTVHRRPPHTPLSSRSYDVVTSVGVAEAMRWLHTRTSVHPLSTPLPIRPIFLTSFLQFHLLRWRDLDLG